MRPPAAAAAAGSGTQGRRSGLGRRSEQEERPAPADGCLGTERVLRRSVDQAAWPSPASCCLHQTTAVADTDIQPLLGGDVAGMDVHKTTALLPSTAAAKVQITALLPDTDVAEIDGQQRADA